MCWTFMLSTRFYFFEVIFSGLDKAYHAHRILGILSFSFICAHPVFQVLRFLPDWREGFSLFVLRQLAAVELGVLGLILFIILISLTLWVKIPYHIWKKTHEFFILVLLLGFFHTIWIDKQVNDSLLLSVWLYSFISLAIISYIYIRFLYRHIGPKYRYSIQKIEEKGDILSLYLSPCENTMQYKPAQFIYISFDNPKIRKESHPFSVSSSPDKDYLCISVKGLGDYTSRMSELRTGDKGEIWGPYGQFYEKFLCQTKKDAVLIAGGIGITPFLSMLQFEVDHPLNRKIYVYYCINNSDQAYFHDEITSLAERNSSICYTPWYADTQGFMNVENLKEHFKGDLKGKLYFLCGPLVMMRLFTTQLNKNGVKNRNIISEDFHLLD